MSRDSKQLKALRHWLEKSIPELQIDLGLKLWNGEVLALSDQGKTDVCLCIRSPEVVRRLIFSPKLMTVFELYAESLLDIEGGTPLEAARRWDHIRMINFARNLNKFQLLKTLSPFIFKSKKSFASDEASYQSKVENKLSAGRNDKDLIQFHYDVSNEFYQLFLDPEMTYSCGYFETADTPLEVAQKAKLDMICKRLRMEPGDRFLDIGCGWGGLVCHAVQHYGVHAHGVTLSQAQFDFAMAKIKKLGLEDKITLELKDYRDLDMPGVFDKISQIEMFEHVGIDNHDAHFKQVHRLLRSRGLYLHQASTRMATPNIEQFRKQTPYQEIITRFIFPGGELDYIGLSTTNLERHRFEVHDIEAWREHFQITLEHWAQALWDKRAEATEMIGWPRTRLWLLYFSLFALAFERNTVSVFQTLASKRRTGPSGLPLSRKDLYS